MKEKLNLRKKEIIAYLVITILAIVIIIGGSSYAFFTANVKTQNDANKTITGEAKTLVEVHMDYGSEIKSEGMYPGHKVVKTIHITGSGKESSTPVPIKIQLTPEVADFPNHVRYSIYAVENSSIDINSVCGEANNQTSTDKYYDAMECDTSKLGNVLKSGIFVDKEIESYETLVEYNTDRTFYILVEYINDTENDQNSEQNKSFTITLGYEGEISLYKEVLLNGADPILSEGLIPVNIDELGKVTKANIMEEWYSYEKKNWANAVILENEETTYNAGDVIPESNIESYFVWIPKYSYKIQILGTSALGRHKAFEIQFGTNNTNDATEGECTTPMISGENGNCKEEDYMTHPAFLSMGTNGLWVGKFETGYKGATTASEAEIDEADATRLQIKPEVYSWRNIQIANAYYASYNYQRNLDSHMMKNTEWGAVAYLSHSIYGVIGNISPNTKKSLTGYSGNSTNYFHSASGKSSTTGNHSGIYDMSAGAPEYVMGVLNLSPNLNFLKPIYAMSGFTDANFPNENKYYDLYRATSLSARILGDATAETSRWYNIPNQWVSKSDSWFDRGGYSQNVSSFTPGLFNFWAEMEGQKYSHKSFRVVLAI